MSLRVAVAVGCENSARILAFLEINPFSLGVFFGYTVASRQAGGEHHFVVVCARRLVERKLGVDPRAPRASEHAPVARERAQVLACVVHTKR